MSELTMIPRKEKVSITKPMSSRPSAVTEMQRVPGEEPPVVLPYEQAFSLPISVELTLVPGILYKQRIIAGGVDLYLELTLTSFTDTSATLEAKYLYHKQSSATDSSEVGAVHQISDPFTDEVNVVIPLSGSSVKLGRRIERLGQQPHQSVITTSIGAALLPPNLAQ
ncbi:MAG: hypothetical protein AAF098_08120 [Pseudomonadota bacterium]